MGTEPDSSGATELEMRERYLNDLAFPMDERGIRQHAQDKNAPARVLEQLEDLQPGRYSSVDEVIEALREAS